MEGIWNSNPDFKAIVAGEKGKASLQAHYSNNLAIAVTEMGNKGKISYADMAPIVDAISDADYREARFLSNKFNSVISIEPQVRTLKSKQYIIDEVRSAAATHCFLSASRAFH